MVSTLKGQAHNGGIKSLQLFGYCHVIMSFNTCMSNCDKLVPLLITTSLVGVIVAGQHTAATL